MHCSIFAEMVMHIMIAHLAERNISVLQRYVSGVLYLIFLIFSMHYDNIRKILCRAFGCLLSLHTLAFMVEMIIEL